MGLFNHPKGLPGWVCACASIYMSIHIAIGNAHEKTETLTLETAIERAVTNDPWLSSSQHRQAALLAESVAVSRLPDPKISLTGANLPTDTFDLNQEAMTQFSIGISQQMPRGDSLHLSGQQKKQLARAEPLLRQDRMAKVRTRVTKLWLDALKAQESIRLIKQDRILFEQLVDAAKANYSSALGRVRQQDLVRAQLELTQIEDRLTVLQQQFEAAWQRLSEWVGPLGSTQLSGQLPSLKFSFGMLEELSASSQAELYELIQQHPAIRAVDQRISALETSVELVRQKYKPVWNLTAKYGYRDKDPAGRDRADLVSVGLSFDLPVFTSDRQDKEVSASVARAESFRAKKQLMARQLIAQLNTSVVQLRRLNERSALYKQQLLPQMAEQSTASLAAYNNDVGDFAEAVRARISELNAKINALGIQIERLKVISELGYLLASDTAISTELKETN